MEAEQVLALRALLARTRWLERAGTLGRALRTSTRSPGGLLLVGTPAYEPWHLTAHLDSESRLSGIPELMPTLVRWSPPPDAPPHLSVGLARLEAARRGETLFVVSSQTAPVPLLERVNDARRLGATILALGSGADAELGALAHESLTIPGAPPAPATPPPSATSAESLDATALDATAFDAADLAGRTGLLTFDAAQHLVSAAAGDRNESDWLSSRGRGAGRDGRGARGLRDRIARLLDIVSGPSA